MSNEPIPPPPDAFAETAPASDAEPDDPPTPGFGPPADPGGVRVEVSDTQSFLRPAPGAVESVVRATLAAEGVCLASVSVALVDDATIHSVNRAYLGHDWPTDVISFTLSDPDDPALSGELVVSAETAAAEARESGVPAWDELALYLVHGLLHLCGHDDTNDEARVVMRRREHAVLTSLGLSHTFGASPEAEGSGVLAGGTGVSGAVGRLRGASRWQV